MGQLMRLIGTGVAIVGAVAVLASVRDTLVDVGADVLLVASLLTLAHGVFRLVDDPDEEQGQHWHRP
jgi:hypothetical protein